MTTTRARETPTGRTPLVDVAAGVHLIFANGGHGMTGAQATAAAERYVRSHGWTPAQYTAAVRRPR